jgi:hypothetical protein
MRKLTIAVAVVGVLIAIADALFRLTHDYRVGFEQALEFLLVALILAVAQLWPPERGQQPERPFPLR